MKTKQTLKIDIYSDVICPWCWLGKARFEKALEEVKPGNVELRYLPYELNPATPPEGRDRLKYLEAKYGSAISSMDAKLAGLGKEMGLDYHFEKAEKIPNTFNAHRVIWLAEKEGVQKPVIEAFYEAYFSRGLDLGDKRVLIETASKAGLDAGKVEKLLASEEGTEEIHALEHQALSLGVSGVPFFVFNNESAVSGAQSVETFVSILKELTA